MNKFAEGYCNLDMASAKKSGAMPNVLWICTDQQRFDTIGALGNPHIKTPNLDRLVSQGVAFTRAYTQSPVCSPSRASFLTGRYPRTTGVTKNGGAYFPAEEVLVTGMLSEKGYTCGLVGKLHLSSAQEIEEKRPDKDGYKVFKWSHSPIPDGGPRNDYHQWLKRKGITWENEYKGSMGGIEPKYHQSTWCGEEATGFIEENSKKPWVLSVNIFDPHPPFDPPKEYRKRYRAEDMPLPLWRDGELEEKPLRQREDYLHGRKMGDGRVPCDMSDMEKKNMVADYYAMIELLDFQVGRMVEALVKTGQKENTIIIFHSDHGDMLGDHGLLHKAGYFYEGLVHVPLIMCWEGHFKAGLKPDALVELVDLAPTILEAAGIEKSYSIQGKSLMGILSGDNAPHTHKANVYCEYYNSLKGVHEGSYATMYFDGRFKTVIYHGAEEGEIYDLEADPQEYTNLWDKDGCGELKLKLLKKCFDLSINTIDPNPPWVNLY